MIEENLESSLFFSSSNLEKPDIASRLLDTSKKPTALKTIFRTANILTCLNNGIDSVTDIATACNLDKATIHRLLRALVEARIIMQDPITRKYYTGPLVAEIASNPKITHEHFVSCAIQEMRSLSKLTGESIGLNVLIGVHTVLLYEIQSSQDHKIVAKKRVAGNIHAGAHGKALLCLLNNKNLILVLSNIDFERLTEYTITFKEKFIAELKQARQQGYAVSFGERIPGGMTIAAPIKNYVLPAALGILGPEIRMKPRMAEFIQAIMESRDRISENLKQMYP